MTGKDLLAIFGASDYTFTVNIADITHEMSLQTLADGGSCVNWITGHSLRSRQYVLKLLGMDFVIDPETMPQYVGGEGFTNENALPIDEMTAMMKESMSLITRGIAKATQESLDEDLPDPFMGRTVSRGRMIGLYCFHESYHMGQIGMMRRPLGLEGAIQV